MEVEKLNLDKPEFDQSTYVGRVRHFVKLTNPMNLFESDSSLAQAKLIVESYKRGEETGMTAAQLWSEKYKYDSAFHPETGSKMFLPGRMSAWVPSNMTITGAMLYFQKTPQQVIFWQFANQAVNATVNYTNRSGNEEISTSTLARNFASATTLAVATAMAIKKFAPKFLSRLSPFFAVCAANCLNTPLMRSSELENGIRVMSANGDELGTSKTAAEKAIKMVCVQRIACAIPAMVFPLYGMMYMEKKIPRLARGRIGGPLLQVFLVGLSLLVANPLTCALFPQMSSINANELEPEISKKYPNKLVYYNRGL